MQFSYNILCFSIQIKKTNWEKSTATTSLNFNFGYFSPSRTSCASEDKGLVAILITMQISVPLGRDVYGVHP